MEDYLTRELLAEDERQEQSKEAVVEVEAPKSLDRFDIHSQQGDMAVGD